MANFEQAARKQFRFDSSKGQLSVEQLWQLPLTGNGVNLDDIAKALFRQIKDADGEVSFVKPTVAADNMLQAKFDIVKHIIDVKLAERDAADKAAATRVKNQKIMALIDQKQDEKLSSASIEELRAMLAAE
jgi:hypothetical protein